MDNTQKITVRFYHRDEFKIVAISKNGNACLAIGGQHVVMQRNTFNTLIATGSVVGGIIECTDKNGKPLNVFKTLKF